MHLDLTGSDLTKDLSLVGTYDDDDIGLNMTANDPFMNTARYNLTATATTLVNTWRHAISFQ